MSMCDKEATHMDINGACSFLLADLGVPGELTPTQIGTQPSLHVEYITIFYYINSDSGIHS